MNPLVKRIFDVLFALALIFLFISWLLPLLWALNLFAGSRPLFFSHQREGKDRKLFWCYKFRTFPKNAAHPRPGEPITTPIPWLGNFLRSSGIDELPQALNILKMSVVGPRPHLPEYNAHYQNVVGQECLLLDRWIQRTQHTSRPDRTGPNPGTPWGHT